MDLKKKSFNVKKQKFYWISSHLHSISLKLKHKSFFSIYFYKPLILFAALMDTVRNISTARPFKTIISSSATLKFSFDIWKKISIQQRLLERLTRAEEKKICLCLYDFLFFIVVWTRWHAKGWKITLEKLQL